MIRAPPALPTAVNGRHLYELVGEPPALDRPVLVQTLTSFETFDVLAGPSRSPEEVTPVLLRLARLAVGMGEAEAGDQAGDHQVSATLVGAGPAPCGHEPSSS